MFRLQNDPPRRKPWTGNPAPKTRQRVLFAGMDCLPDQFDLFVTDGPSEPSDNGEPVVTIRLPNED